jgi:hypothetical protein
MSARRALPSSLAPRGLHREAAAEYVGLSRSGFDQARARGDYPKPTLPGGRYDVRSLDLAMDRLSGILTEGEAQTPLEAWRAKSGARGG